MKNVTNDRRISNIDSLKAALAERTKTMQKRSRGKNNNSSDDGESDDSESDDYSDDNSSG